MKLATLVDGTGGFTGKHLLEECLKRGDYVVATDREEVERPKGKEIYEAVEERRLIWVPSNLGDKKSLEDLFREAKRVDFKVKEAYRNAAIFDMSGEEKLLKAVNVEGTRNFCEVASDQGVEKVVYISTASIYKPTEKESETIAEKEENILEEDLLNPYSRSKREGEKIHAWFHKQGLLKSLIIRPGLKYGPGSVYGIVVLFNVIRSWGFIPTVSTGEGIGQARTTYLYSGNDAPGMRHLMKAGNFEKETENPSELAYNLADRYPKEGISQEEVMLLVHEHIFGKGYLPALSRKIQTKIPKPKRLVELAAMINDWAAKNLDFPSLLEPNSVEYYFKHFPFSTEKLAATGFEWPVEDTKAGLKQTLEWYERNNWRGLPGLGMKDLVKRMGRRAGKKLLPLAFPFFWFFF